MKHKTKLFFLPLIMSSLVFACSGSDDKDNDDHASGGTNGDGDGDRPSGGRAGDGDGDGNRPSGGRAGDGDGDGDGEGGLGGLGGSDGTDSSAELADACEARCATTVSLECPENTDQDECEADCTNGAVIGCEDEWLALKRCESMLSSSGFQCLSFLGFNFVDLSLSGHTACVEEFEANDSCEATDG